MNFSTNSRKFQQIPTLALTFFVALNFLFFFVRVEVQAATLSSQTFEKNLLADLQFFEDTTGELSLEQVKQKKESFQKWDQAGTDLNFGFTRSTYWIQIPLQRLAEAPPDWLLELDYAKYKLLKLYTPQGEVFVTGDQAGLSSRPYFDRVFVFPVRVETSLPITTSALPRNTR